MKESHWEHLKFLFVAVFILLLLTVVVLYFIFKPKPPVVTATPITLLHFEFSLTPKVILSMTIGVDVFLYNPNVAPFEYGETVARLYYRGVCVGEAFVPGGRIEKRAAKDIGSPLELLVNRVVSNPKFLSDVTDGVLNMVAISKTEGQVSVLGFVNVHATIYVECSLSVFLLKATTSSKCISKIRF